MHTPVCANLGQLAAHMLSPELVCQAYRCFRSWHAHNAHTCQDAGLDLPMEDVATSERQTRSQIRFTAPVAPLVARCVCALCNRYPCAAWQPGNPCQAHTPEQACAITAALMRLQGQSLPLAPIPSMARLRRACSAGPGVRSRPFPMLDTLTLLRQGCSKALTPMAYISQWQSAGAHAALLVNTAHRARP